MDRNSFILLLLIIFTISLLFGGGCGSAQKQTPHMGFGNFDIRTELTRKDIVVLDRVEGTSTTTSILCGLIEFIDGDKLKLLGIPFYKEKYAYFVQNAYSIQKMGGLWATTADRAYYKALEAAPEADTVFFKSMDHEDEGIPLIAWTKTVTWKGKAIKIGADQ